MNIQFWRMAMLLSIFFSILSIIVVLLVNENFGTNVHPYKYVSDSNAILALLTGICSFMYFKNLRIEYSKIINTIGGSTFGVLLIHGNSDTMRRWLWQDLFKNTEHYYDEKFWIRPIVIVIVIFVSCIIIDYLRIRFIERRFYR